MDVMKSKTVAKSVVDKHVAAEPAWAPAPTPAAPTAEPEPDVNSRPESKSIRWIEQGRVVAPRRRSSNVRRIVHRHVNHLWVGGLNHDCRLPILCFSAYGLLWARGQMTVRLCRKAQPLDRAHHVGLLCQKSVS